MEKKIEVKQIPEFKYPKQPVCVIVKYALMNAFRFKVDQEPDCKIVKVIERITCEALEYWITCPKEKEEYIVDLGFMTFIKNPKFQKYYLSDKDFQAIAVKYLSEHHVLC